jgi:hypothetical protein
MDALWGSITPVTARLGERDQDWSLRCAWTVEREGHREMGSDGETLCTRGRRGQAQAWDTDRLAVVADVGGDCSCMLQLRSKVALLLLSMCQCITRASISTAVTTGKRALVAFDG